MRKEEQERENRKDGMARAWLHAVDMNKNGDLDEKELEEFRRYVVGLAVGEMTMEEHVAASKNGMLEQQIADAAHDDDVDIYDGQKSREALARNIVANFINMMWEAGHVDDETYAVEMQKLGITDERGREAGKKKWEAGGEEPPIGDGAVNIWLGQVGLDDMTEHEIPGPEASDGRAGHGMDQYLSPPVRELSAADVAEFQSRQKKR